MLEVVSFMEEDAKTHAWVRGDTYGGKLTENVVQAICRDLERDSMLRVEAAGWPVVHHCHDELLSLAIKKAAAEMDAELSRFKVCVSQVEPWAAGFPLKCGGWHGDRYRK
jgi:DNA polymerase